MMINQVSVGIDYHSESLQVCVMNAFGEVQTNRKVKNDVEDVIRAVGQASSGVTVAAEACNGSASFLDELHQRTGWSVRLCHPGYAQRMKNNPDKTDKSDGELIADLTRIGYLPEVWLAPAELRDLRALARYRALQMNERRSVKLRIRALLRNNRIKIPEGLSIWTQKGKAWLSSELALMPSSAWIMGRYLSELLRFGIEIKSATTRLTQYVKEDRLCQELIKQPGIGIITAAVMRAEIGTFRRFKNGKQLARFCGLSPCNRSSGAHNSDSGTIRAGNPLLKACITQGIWSLIRHHPEWKQFAAAMAQRGKPAGVIASAVANRWVRKLFHAVKVLEV